jgi:hypothetical protein
MIDSSTSSRNVWAMPVLRSYCSQPGPGRPEVAAGVGRRFPNVPVGFVVNYQHAGTPVIVHGVQLAAAT